MRQVGEFISPSASGTLQVIEVKFDGAPVWRVCSQRDQVLSVGQYPLLAPINRAAGPTSLSQVMHVGAEEGDRAVVTPSLFFPERGCTQPQQPGFAEWAATDRGGGCG